IGVLSNALQQGLVAPEEYQRIRPFLLSINRIGADVGALPEVSAMTDVTGFGLIGHALEMAEGAGLALDVQASAVPLIEGERDFAPIVLARGSGGWRNLANAEGKAAFADALDRSDRLMLVDPQSNGGLLIAVSPAGLDRLVAVLETEPQGRPAVIGRF